MDALIFENLDRFFSGQTIIEKKALHDQNIFHEDLWTKCISLYMNQDEQGMAQLIGQLKKVDWSEEEKLLMNIFLGSRCYGSNQLIKDLKGKLQQFRHEDAEIEEQISYAGKILLDRGDALLKDAHKKEVERLNKIADEKAKRLAVAQRDLRIHENSGNRS